MRIKTSATERLDRRYLLIETENKDSIAKAIVKLGGAMGLAQAAAVIVEDLKKDNSKKIILAVNRDAVDLVKAACELSEEKITVLRVSGTIKGLKR